MQIARVRHGGRPRFAVLRDGALHLVRGGLASGLEETGQVLRLEGARLLAPVRPSKIVAIGLNYRTHLDNNPLDRDDQAARDEPAHPEAFLKTPSSVIGPGDAIELPPDAGRVDEEGEVVAVIGRRARRLSEAEVDDHVLGYTCGNDVSAREWQQSDLQWWRAKSSDTFTAVGPWITTGLDPERIHIVTRLNGRVVQEATTAELIHSIRRCIARITSAMTLEPGDLVFTGTPGATSALSPGDRVEVEIEGVGVLANPVVAAAE